jgi:hypothetical protein
VGVEGLRWLVVGRARLGMHELEPTQGPSHPQSKVIFGRFCQLLAINTHKMAPRPPQGLQDRPWDTATKGLLWFDPHASRYYPHVRKKLLPPGDPKPREVGTAPRQWRRTWNHARPFEPQSKVNFGRFHQLLAINAHKMAPSTG